MELALNDDKASPRLCPIGAPIVPDYATKMWDRRGKAGSFKASAPNADEKQSSFAWHAVIAAFVVAVFGWGTGLYGPSVYLEVVSRTQGWSVAAVSGAITLHFLIGLVVIPTLPTLYRHLGIAIVTAASGVLMAIGIFGLSVARQIWQLYAFGLLTGIGWSGLGAAAVTAIVVPWFTAKRSLALGLAFNGGSVGGIVFSPLWVGLIDKFGFVQPCLSDQS
jgi:MFS family permease